MHARPSNQPIRLDAEWLQSVGLGDLPPAAANEFLSYVYDRLETSVGSSLAERMTNDQLDEFEALIAREDEAGALGWLEDHFPDYPDTVREHFELPTRSVQADAGTLAEILCQEAAPHSEETR